MLMFTLGLFSTMACSSVKHLLFQYEFLKYLSVQSPRKGVVKSRLNISSEGVGGEISNLCSF